MNRAGGACGGEGEEEGEREEEGDGEQGWAEAGISGHPAKTRSPGSATQTGFLPAAPPDRPHHCLYLLQQGPKVCVFVGVWGCTQLCHGPREGRHQALWLLEDATKRAES